MKNFKNKETINKTENYRLISLHCGFRTVPNEDPTSHAHRLYLRLEDLRKINENVILDYGFLSRKNFDIFLNELIQKLTKFQANHDVHTSLNKGPKFYFCIYWQSVLVSALWLE